MRFSHRRASLIVTMLFATTVLLSGCTVFRAKDRSGMVATLQSVQDDYKEAGLETEATLEALNELAVSDPVDLDQAYQAFSESVDRIQWTGQRLVVHADRMHFGGASYLVESGRSPTACVYPRPRLPEDTKAAELGDYFDAIADEGWFVKRAFRAFQFDITQIRDHLSNHLNPNGVAAMDQIIGKAQVDAESLKESLQQARAAIERAKSATEQAVHLPPPPPS